MVRVRGRDVCRAPTDYLFAYPSVRESNHEPVATPGPSGIPSAIDDVAAELEAIAERLADLALDHLRQAAENPDNAAERARLLAEERRVTRARRAVEKAVALLQNQPSGTVEP